MTAAASNDLIKTGKVAVTEEEQSGNVDFQGLVFVPAAEELQQPLLSGTAVHPMYADDAVLSGGQVKIAREQQLIQDRCHLLATRCRESVDVAISKRSLHSMRETARHIELAAWGRPNKEHDARANIVGLVVA